MGHPMDDTITESQIEALRNLAVKRTGDMKAFVNIADAQRLTELGLASRSRQGWDITALGSSYLARADAGGWRDNPLV